MFVAQAVPEAIAILLHGANFLLELLMKAAELGVIGTSAFGCFGHLASSRADAVAGLLAGRNVNALLLGGADALALLLFRAFLLAGVGLSAALLAGIRRLPALTGRRSGSGATAALSASAPAGALAAALSGCGKCKQC